HWYVNGPAPVMPTLNVAASPFVTVRFCGCDEMIGGVFIVVTATAMLFVGFTSRSRAKALTRFVAAPSATATPSTRYWIWPRAAIGPILQMLVQPVADVTRNVLGSTLVSTTPVAVAGPRLLTVTV